MSAEAAGLFITFAKALISKLFGSATSGSNQAIQNALEALGSGQSAIYDRIGIGVAQSTNTTYDAANEVKNYIDQKDTNTRSIINNIGDFIKGKIDVLTNVVNDVNNSHFLAIMEGINNVFQEAEANYNILVRDLGGGLNGLLQVPKDLATGLSSLDSVLSRGIDQQGRTNTQIAAEILGPAILGAGSIPLEPLTQAFSVLTDNPAESAVYEKTDALREYLGSLSYECADPTAPRTAHTIEGGTPQQLIDAANAWLAKIKTGTHWYEKIASDIWAVLLAFESLSAELVAVTHRSEQAARRAVPDALIDPASTIEALRRGLMSKDEACYELASAGFDPSRQKILYDLAQFLFSPRDAVALFARGAITRSDLYALADQNNLSHGQMDALEKLMNQLAGPREAIVGKYRGFLQDAEYQAFIDAALIPEGTQQLLEALTIAAPNARVKTRLTGRLLALEGGFLAASLGSAAPAELVAQYTENLLSEAEAAQDWLSHWAVPPPEWWIDAWFRGAVDKGTVLQAMDAENIPREIQDTLFTVAEELPPVWLIPDVVGSGVWSEAEAIPQLKKLGFSDANAKVLYEYGKSKTKTSKSQTAADLQGLSLGASAKLYADGAIDAPTYTDLLTVHGLGPEAAKLTVQLADITNAQKARDDFVAFLVDQVTLGAITQTDAESQLFQQGFTDKEVAAAIVKIERAAAKNFKLPSKADADKMLEKGIIDVTTWRQVMSKLGYQEPWQTAYLELLGVPSGPAS